MDNNYTFAKALPTEFYITRLKKNSDVIKTLTKFVLDHNITGGFINDPPKSQFVRNVRDLIQYLPHVYVLLIY